MILRHKIKRHTRRMIIIFPGTALILIAFLISICLPFAYVFYAKGFADGEEKTEIKIHAEIEQAVTNGNLFYLKSGSAIEVKRWIRGGLYNARMRYEQRVKEERNHE